MAIVNPMGDVYETLLTTLATTAVFPTSEPIVEIDVNALLTKTASKRTTKPLVEMELLLKRAHNSLLDELDDLVVSSEANVPEEFPTRTHHTRAATTRQAIGSEDSFYSYLRDIRGLGLLTPDEEIDLARQIATGDELAFRKLIESNLRLVITIARRYMVVTPLRGDRNPSS